MRYSGKMSIYTYISSALTSRLQMTAAFRRSNVFSDTVSVRSARPYAVYIRGREKGWEGWGAKPAISAYLPAVLACAYLYSYYRECSLTHSVVSRCSGLNLNGDKRMHIEDRERTCQNGLGCNASISEYLYSVPSRSLSATLRLQATVPTYVHVLPRTSEKAAEWTNTSFS